MLRRVFKYILDFSRSDIVNIDLPKDAEILTIDMQFGSLQLWALVDPLKPLQKRIFRMAGTGHPIENENLDYINTFQEMGGSLIWHIFEIRE